MKQTLLRYVALYNRAFQKPLISHDLFTQPIDLYGVYLARAGIFRCTRKSGTRNIRIFFINDHMIIRNSTPMQAMKPNSSKIIEIYTKESHARCCTYVHLPG